jgi:hypothetical protein
VLAYVGTVPSVTSVAGHGGAWAKYEQDFESYAENHWSWEGADNFNANYYDRAMIYYVWWARTGNATYLDRANQLALSHRAYVESAHYRPQPYLLMVDGLALHAIVTGDPRSRLAVATLADKMAAPSEYWARVVGDWSNVDLDARTQSRVLNTVLAAWYLRAPSTLGLDYAQRLRVLMPAILGTQASDGAFRFTSDCSQSKPFMTGMLNDALERYYTLFEADARIPAAVKRAVDYMWSANWDAASGQFRYRDDHCNGEPPYLTGDLNNLVVTGYAFTAKVTGDRSYMTKADAIFTGGVYGAWLTGTKQFNQQYTTSYRYLGLRF